VSARASRDERMSEVRDGFGISFSAAGGMGESRLLFPVPCYDASQFIRDNINPSMVSAVLVSSVGT
jgi:hypothetical protein